MDLLTLLPVTPGLTLVELHINQEQRDIRVCLAVSAPTATCPQCQTPSRHFHSRYDRHIRDLPWADWAVHLILTARKFRCHNPACLRRVFCERLPTLVAPWGRRTLRLAEDQRHVALALGGAAGARLLNRRALQVSRTTLLRLVRATPCPTFPTPRVLGVDDWAKRKRHSYGAVLVDLERSQPIALLPDREAETLRAWLEAHPGVEIVARDRFGAFADGVRLGAPDAQHVLDRFHLMQNLAVALEKVLGRHRALLSPTLPPPVLSELPPLHDPVTTMREPTAPAVITVPPGLPTAKSKERRQKRLERYDTIKALHAKGWTNSAIARHLNTDRRSVRHAVQADTFPEFRRRARKLDPYKVHLVQRWNEGCRTSPVLLSEIQNMGYLGSRTAVAIYLQRLRQAQGLPRRSRNAHPDHPTAHVNVRDAAVGSMTPFEAALSVLRRPEKCTEADHALLAQLCTSTDEVREAVELSQAFAMMLRERHADRLDEWLDRATRSSAAALSRLARGLQREAEAVRAALLLPWSTGPVEGHINRLKLLKRQMYGRAKLDLLERRFLEAA
ncbi:MAG: ISL3 family transposase [Deinococcota bacterium]|nr:ISL3 family transposase [Deinococcota bacterium]